MGSIQNMVFYCCVAKGKQILYAHSCGDCEIEELAFSCLERAPPLHTWYFHSVSKRTYGFLMEDGYVFFTILEGSLGNPAVRHLLGHVRDQFKMLAKRGSRGSISFLNSACLQEKRLIDISHLLKSLEQVWQSQPDGDRMPGDPPSQHPRPSTSPESGQTEVSTSTKAPLLWKFSKQEKKKTKDHVIEIRDNGSEEHQKSMGRGIKVDASTTEFDNQGVVVSSISVQKGSNSMRIMTDPRHGRDTWWRQVWIVIAIDLVICVILFAVWLGICGGFECISG